MNAIAPARAAAEAAPGWPDDGLTLVKEPRKNAPGLDSLLRWAHETGASRVEFASGHRVTIDVHGATHFVTQEPLNPVHVQLIANHFYGPTGSARLENGHDFDAAYSIGVTRIQQLRFRLNATPVETRRGIGATIVLRPIPDMPPLLVDQRVEPEILAASRPQSGMIFVGGSTGSGKTTLIGGFMVAKVKEPTGRCHIATGEAPIEFLLDHVIGPQGQSIRQSEIPRHLGAFADFVRGAMRRELTDIMVGECRDSATMVAAINAAMTGNVLTTTIHADDVPLMMQRAASLCPADERSNLVSALAQAMRLCINQRLVRAIDGRRTPIREFLVFDREIRREMLRTDPQEWAALVETAVRERGQSFAVSIRKALAEGRITEETAEREMRRDT